MPIERSLTNVWRRLLHAWSKNFGLPNITRGTPRASRDNLSPFRRSSRSDAANRISEAIKLASRRPGLIVAGRLRPAAARQRRARRTVSRWRPRHVWYMRLFPFARLVILLGRRHVHHMVQPAVPAWRNAGRFGEPVIDHPAPLEVQRRVDLAAFGAVIAIALRVLPDQLAEPVGPELRAKGLAVPPGEELQEKLLHAACRLMLRFTGRDAIGPRKCPARRDSRAQSNPPKAAVSFVFTYSSARAAFTFPRIAVRIRNAWPRPRVKAVP